MSSTKVKKIEKVINFTSVYDTDKLVVTAASAHNLVTGDLVSLTFQDSPQEFVDVAVTVVDTTNFTIVVPNHTITKGQVHIKFFRTGETGRQVFTLPRSAGHTSLIQSFVTGTGGAGYTPEVSLDGIHWVALTAVTHPGTDGDSDFTTIEPAWAYGAINITSIGAATKLEVLYSN